MEDSKKEAKKENDADSKPDQEEEATSSEFGVLPDRDIKKNLGCG